MLQRFLRENWLLLVVLAAIVVAYVALRTEPSDVRSLDEIQAMVARGPVLVELYSNT